MNLYLDSSLESKKFGPDEVIFKEGDKVTGFYIVKSGSVVCLKEFNKRLIPILNAVEKEIVAEELVFSKQENYSYSAITLSNCELVFIAKSEVDEFLRLKNDWIKDILLSVAIKIEKTSELIAEHRILNEKINPFEDFDFVENKLRKILNNS